MTAGDPVRWGVLGTASIARRLVIPAMQRSTCCRVVAIASRDGGRARTVADALGIARAYGSYEALLDDGGRSRLHPASQPSACPLVEPCRRGGQARPV
jgi:hypothetical protein